MTYGHLRADCLYTWISSGPNARCRVWKAFTFTFLPITYIVQDLISLQARLILVITVHNDTSLSALTLLVRWQEGHPACKKLSGGMLAQEVSRVRFVKFLVPGLDSEVED